MEPPMLGAEGGGDGDGAQVLLKFVTKLPQELRVPETPVTVPAALTRYGLSQIVNHLLALDPPRPFDFLVGGELLRTPLAALLAARGLSAEAVLAVEYVPAVLPPTPGAEARLDDWIAALAALPPLALSAAGKKSKAAAGGGGDSVSAAAAPLAAGCYDGVVRIWTADAGVAAEWAAHEGPVKAVACAPGARGAAGGMLLTGGDDCAARAWAWRGAAPGGAPEAAATLAGHAAAVEAAAVGPGGGLAATGGWDGQLLLWRWGEALLESASAGAAAADGAAAAARKRRRAAAPPPEEAPAGALGGHTGCVAALCWAAPDSLISGSWDASVRRWDPEVGAAAEALHHDKAVHAVAAAPGGDGRVVAFGGAERALRLWDARAGGAAVGVRGLASHSAWVSALAWHPESAHALLSASHDGAAKLWDLRAAVPLASVAAGGGEKLLAAAWASPGTAAVGGADCALRTFGVEL